MTVSTDGVELAGLVTTTISSIGRATAISIWDCVPSTNRDRGRKTQPTHRAACGGEWLATATPTVDPKISTAVLAIRVFIHGDPASIPTPIPQCALTIDMAHSSGLNGLCTARVRDTSAGKRWTVVAFNAPTRRTTAAVAWSEVRAAGNRMSGLWIEARRRVPRGGRGGTEDVGGRRVRSRGACKLRVGRVLGREWGKGVTLLALPDASLAKKLGRDLEALEFEDGGYIGKRIDRAMGVVGGWSQR